MPLSRCSRTTIFLNTDHKDSRDSLLLPFTQLEKLDDNDENVYCKNIIDRYAARPEKLEDMCLAQFAANYTYKRETANDVAQYEDNISGESDTELPPDDNVSKRQHNYPPKWSRLHEEEKPESNNKMAQLQHRKRS